MAGTLWRKTWRDRSKYSQNVVNRLGNEVFVMREFYMMISPCKEGASQRDAGSMDETVKPAMRRDDRPSGRGDPPLYRSGRP